jgi:hypothetical protein
MCSLSSLAAPKSADTGKTSTGQQPSTLAEAAALQAAGQIDITATIATPMVTNIVSWQEQDTRIPKNPLEFSALKDSLMPTDRDRLASEIRYTQILNRASEDQQK